MGTHHLEPEYTLSSRGRRDGPFSEAELILRAREGGIRAGDRIRAQGEKRWTRASRVPWLSDRDGQPLKETGTPTWIQVLALVLVLVALVGVLAVQRDADRAKAIDLGVVLAPAPDPALAIHTGSWGVVPPGRLNVRFHGDGSHAEADVVAAAIGGIVVGELPLLDLYVLDFPSRTEQGLRTALAIAQTQTGVRSAFPEQIAFLAGPAQPCTLTDDPAYAGERGRALEMIGAQLAWNCLRASGTRLQPVAVGIVDTGIYLGHGEFDGGVRVEARGASDRLAEPTTGRDRAPLSYYSHGTGVASVLAADGDDGGVTGLASILGDRLTLYVRNAFRDGFEAHPSTGDKPLGAYAISTLAVIQRQIEDGARVVNLSWCLGFDATTGALRPVHPGIYRAYRDFFRKMGRKHPDVVFVCSAGNQGGTPEDEGFLPGGLDLPNVVTVGNLDAEGRAEATGTNRMASGRAFHVDLAAPGQGIPYGIGPDGVVAAGDGGTSMAAPLVTATVAILKAVDPELGCAEIKEILRATARREIQHADGTRHSVLAEVGQGCLAVDLAVLEVLNRRRAKLGERERLDLEALLTLTRIDLEAVREEGAEGGRWVVTASVPRTPQATTTLTIHAGEEASVDGSPTVTVTAGQTVRWVVAPAQDHRVEVARADTQARWRVLLED